MKVIFDGAIFQYQSKGGISRIFREILPQLCLLNENVEILVVTSGKLLQSLPCHDRIRHVPLFPITDILRPRRSWMRSHESLKRFLISKQVDSDARSVWLSSYYTMSPTNWPGKEVVFVYDMIHEKFANLFEGKANAIFRERKQQAIQSAGRVICISEATRRDVLDIYGVAAEKVSVAHLAHSPVFRKLGNREKELRLIHPFVLYVGGRARYKNFRLLVEAYSRWSNRCNIHLAIVGDPWTHLEMELLRQHDLVDCVHLFAEVSDVQLNALYNAAEAFVYPSLYEGFGIPLLEAMACGCPLVVSNIPSSKEVAGDCAQYFDPLSTSGLLSALDRALLEGRDAASVQCGLKRASQFSWSRTAEMIMEIIEH